MNKEEITKVDKFLLNKIEHILGSELSSNEYNEFYNYFNKITKPNIIVDIKNCEEVIKCIKSLNKEIKGLEKELEILKGENNDNKNI